jgi:two-component system, chemotaxis family, chemotaxis protein CheY
MTENNSVKVIIADDEAPARMLMKRIILPLNYLIIGEAENGVVALDLYKKVTPDILMLDIEMPLMNGAEVLGEIQKMDSKSCVIMMTSVADSDIVKKCLQLGAANYILKSTPLNDIRQRIKDTYDKYLFFR